MTRAARPLARALTVLLLAVPTAASLTAVGAATGVVPTGGCALAGGAHHAGLVVEHGDGSVLDICVPFTSDTITGEEVLKGSGLEYATAPYNGYGQAVCQIDNEPASYPSSCWTASSQYWALFVKRGTGGWGFASQGVSTLTLHDGDTEGFRYEGQSDYSAPPPPPPGLCPPPVTPDPVPTAAPPASQPPSPTRVPASPAGTGPGSGNAPSSGPAGTASSSPSPPSSGVAAAAVGPGSAASPPPGVTTATRAGGATGPPRAASSPVGAVAAAVLGVALLALLSVQGVRRRRRRTT